MGPATDAALESEALRLELAVLRNETSIALEGLRHATDTVFYLLAAIIIFFSIIDVLWATSFDIHASTTAYVPTGTRIVLMT